MPYPRHDNSAELQDCARKMRNLPESRRRRVAILAAEAGLMVYGGQVGFIIATVKTQSQAARDAFWAKVAEAQPELLDQMFEGTINHMLCGKDTSHPASVGGFNQDELNRLIDMVVEPDLVEAQAAGMRLQ